jgi:TetR/AcrR family transcriptional regulator, cholesterol catabolism regulator
MKNSAKKQQILTAAADMFRETHNVKKVSLEDIAAKAGVSPTTVYNNFGNREALVAEVVKLLLQQTLTQSRQIVASDLPVDQKIMSIINMKKDLVGQINSEIIEKIVSQDNSMIPSIEEIYQSEIRPLWSKILAEGKREGYIDANLNDEVLLIYLDVMKTGFAAKKDLMQKIATNVDWLMQLSHLLFYGFLKKDIGLLNGEGK